MALIICPECGKEVSERAEKCPGCGYPLSPSCEVVEETTESVETPSSETTVAKRKKPPKAILIAAVILIIAGIVFVLYSQSRSSDGEPVAAAKITSAKENSIRDGKYEEVINTDAANAIDSITKEYEALSEAITDYASYIENRERVEKWYAYCMERSGQLYGEIAEDNYSQYVVISASVSKGYSEWNGALSASYKVWNNAMQDYYKAWSRLYEDAYKLFDRTVNDGYDTASYEQASDTWEAMYDLYSDSWENMYDLYSSSWEDLYDFHEEVFSKFYDGSTDIKDEFETIFDKEEKSAESTGGSVSDDEMRSDFKEAMDSYEQFMSGYVDFMKKYKANPNDISLLADYSDYMAEYADMVKKFDSWESNDLSTAELTYYIDVQSRVSKLLLEVAG